MTASASESILARVRKEMQRAAFWSCFERLGPDEYRFTPTGESFSRVWASYIFGLNAREGEVFE